VGGGRAAVFHEDTILFGHAAPVDGTSAADRFCAMGRLLRAALARLGLVAQIGELAGEYCPGSHSLHASGIKLAGIAQRVTGAVAWTEGVVVVGGGGRVRAVLEPVYAALGVEWAPSTAGALDDLLPGVRWEEAAAAVRAELAARFAVVDEPALPRAAAAARRARHDAAGASPAPGAAGERAKVAIG
jgi:lipoate-protein ligase A